MFATLVPFALVPVYGLIAALAPLFGVGYGAYLSGSWAMASDVLPSKEDSAKDMGIWQMSVATPQVLAGAVGAAIDFANRQQAGSGYTLAFLFASGVFLAGCLLVTRVRGSS
jgi:MFS family permease